MQQFINLCLSSWMSGAARYTVVTCLTLACAMNDAAALPPGNLTADQGNESSRAVMGFLEDSNRSSIDAELMEVLATAESLSFEGPADRRFGEYYWAHAFNPLDAGHVKKLEQVFQAASSVKQLTLSNFPASGAVMASLPGMLKGNPNLKYLGVYNVAQGQPGFEAFVSQLPAITSLTSVALAGDDYTDDVWPALAQALSQMGQLEELSLSDLGNFSVATADVAEVLEAVATLSKLNELDLSGNAFGVQMATSVGETLRRLPELSRLNLRSLYLGDAGIHDVLPAIDGLRNLLWIDLGRNKFSDATQLKLREYFASRPSTILEIF